MSTSNLNDQDNRTVDPNLLKVPRAPPTMEKMHRLLMFVNQSLAGITTEQQNARLQIQEMSAKRTSTPGFEQLPTGRDLNKG